MQTTHDTAQDTKPEVYFTVTQSIIPDTLEQAESMARNDKPNCRRFESYEPARRDIDQWARNVLLQVNSTGGLDLVFGLWDSK